MLHCGVFSFEVLGTGSLGSTPSILAISDNERLLFDCGDGTQRLCTEYGARVSKISRVYLTRNEPHANGGLGGFLLTRSDLPAGGKTSVVGPPGLGRIVRSYRHFYNRPGCLVSAFEIGCEQFPFATADGVHVEPVMVGGPDRTSSGHAEKRSRRTSPSEVSRGFEVYESDFSIPGPSDLAFAASYILSLPERRGKFHPEKAAKLGVKPGPDYGKLTRGIAITLPDGRIVSPKDCMDQAEPPPMAAIVWCPSVSHLVQLSEHDAMRKLQSEHAKQVNCVLHVSPQTVLASPEYRKWAARFSTTTSHIGIGENLSPTHAVFLSSCKLQCRLSVLDSVGFPFNEPVGKPGVRDIENGWIAADVRTRFCLAPARTQGLDVSRVPAGIDIEEERAAAAVLLGPQQIAEPLVEVERSQQGIPEVLFLGTGSAIPSKYRNVSALMLHWSNAEYGDIMVDCGEGSVSQLARSLGSIEAARTRIYSLAFAWISHMHADHHLGLLTLLAERVHKGNLPPLIVAGPSPLSNFLGEYSKALGGDFGAKFAQSYVFLDCEAMLSQKQIGFEPPALRRLKELAGLRAATSVSVVHCYKAYALVLETLAGWKFVYSGDTEFCADLVSEGNGAHVLVHEATFEDGKENEAKDKKHSTISQALAAAVGMQAKVVIFSHFSQRYPKNPPLPATASGSTVPVFAFDLMSFQHHRALEISRKAALFDALLADSAAADDDDEEASND